MRPSNPDREERIVTLYRRATLGRLAGWLILWCCFVVVLYGALR